MAKQETGYRITIAFKGNHMQNQSKSYNQFFIMFAFGVLSGLVLITLATWADLEAAYYGFSRRASTPLSGFSCPVLMTATETNTVSLKLKNTTDGKISPTILVETSSPVAAFETTENLELAAGESTIAEWAVGPENLDLKRFIFAKALVYSSYPFPDRETTCGIYVLNLPGNGTIFTWGLVILSLLGMGIGLYGVHQFQGPVKRGADTFKQLLFLAIVVLFGFLSIYIGSWLLGILVLVVSILFVFISTGIVVGRHRV